MHIFLGDNNLCINGICIFWSINISFHFGSYISLCSFISMRITQKCAFFMTAAATKNTHFWVILIEINGNKLPRTTESVVLENGHHDCYWPWRARDKLWSWFSQHETHCCGKLEEVLWRLEKKNRLRKMSIMSMSMHKKYLKKVSPRKFTM